MDFLKLPRHDFDIQTYSHIHLLSLVKCVCVCAADNMNTTATTKIHIMLKYIQAKSYTYNGYNLTSKGNHRSAFFSCFRLCSSDTSSGKTVSNFSRRVDFSFQSVTIFFFYFVFVCADVVPSFAKKLNCFGILNSLFSVSDRIINNLRNYSSTLVFVSHLYRRSRVTITASMFGVFVFRVCYMCKPLDVQRENFGFPPNKFINFYFDKLFHLIYWAAVAVAAVMFAFKTS